MGIFSKKVKKELLSGGVGYQGVEVFCMVDTGTPVVLGYHFPEPFQWTVGIIDFKSKKEATDYFRQAYERERARGNATAIQDFGEWKRSEEEKVKPVHEG